MVGRDGVIHCLTRVVMRGAYCDQLVGIRDVLQATDDIKKHTHTHTQMIWQYSGKKLLLLIANINKKFSINNVLFAIIWSHNNKTWSHFRTKDIRDI